MNYKELRKIDVGDHVEKKNGLSYLSWSWAVDTLLQHDPMATWDFPEPKYYGETVMVFCEVSAFGKVMKMHLPVMDYKNQAVKNPDSRKISDSQMRCLAKCIASFGIGLYLYSGEDLPADEGASPSLEPQFKPIAPKAAPKVAPNSVIPKANVTTNMNRGSWSISAENIASNLPSVLLAAEALLAVVETEEDLKAMFQVNRGVFDEVQKVSPEEYQALMNKFTLTKEKLKG